MASSPRASRCPADRSWVAFTLRPEARFHDGSAITVDDVIWTFETLKSQGPALLPELLRPGGEGREGRRSQGQVHLRSRGEPRVAPDRRPAPRPFPGATGASATSRRRPWSLPSAAAPTAWRRSMPGAPSPTGGSRTTGGPSSPCASARTTSTACATTTTATSRWRWRPSRAASSISARKTWPRTGPPPTTSPPSPRVSSRRRASRTRSPPECRPSSTTRGGPSSRTRACGRPWPTPSTSTG